MTDENHWNLERINTNVNPGNFGRFKTVVLGVYCTACRASMLSVQWPSHYRTKAHAVNRRAEAAR